MLDFSNALVSYDRTRRHGVSSVWRFYKADRCRRRPGQIDSTVGDVPAIAKRQQQQSSRTADHHDRCSGDGDGRQRGGL